jgi:hypothetical protein
MPETKADEQARLVQEYGEAIRRHQEAERAAKQLVARLREAADGSADWQVRLAGGPPGVGKTLPGLAKLPAGEEIRAALTEWRDSLGRLRHLWARVRDKSGLPEPPEPQPG